MLNTLLPIPFQIRSPYRWRQLIITLTTTLDYYNVQVIASPAGSITINLPTAVGAAGKFFEIKNVTGNQITVDPAGSETIDGSSTYVMTIAGESITFVSNGTNWVLSSLPSFATNFANQLRYVIPFTIKSPANETVPLLEYATASLTINRLIVRAIGSTPTLTLGIQNGGVNVGSLSAVAVTSVQSSTTATTNTSIVAGNRIDAVISSVSGVNILTGVLDCTLT